MARNPALSTPPGATPYWSRSSASLLVDLASVRTGLSSDLAAERLKRDGSNSVRAETRLSAVALLLRQFQSPLVLILIFATLVAGVLQQWLEGGIILAIVLGSTLLGFVQEYRASAAVAQLRQRLALVAKVRRGGAVASLPFTEIVVGDIVLLSAGAVVPADAMVLEAQDLLVSEAPLTGESFPVEKRPGVLPAATPISGRTNMVFLGTSVRSGTAEALVVETGQRTQFGAIAEREGLGDWRSDDRPPGQSCSRHIRRNRKPFLNLKGSWRQALSCVP